MHMTPTERGDFEYIREALALAERCEIDCITVETRQLRWLFTQTEEHQRRLDAEVTPPPSPAGYAFSGTSSSTGPSAEQLVFKFDFGGGSN